MFTGIIEGTGVIKSLEEKNDGAEIEIQADFDLEQANVGESIAVNGCCLTITSRLGNTFWSYLSMETLALTTLGELDVGAKVNLERPLKMGDRLGGHMVQGHVDGIGTVVSVEPSGEAKNITVQIPSPLRKYLLTKGSIAIDGVSLTINQCEKDRFCVMIIPHTQLKTTFAAIKAGSRVNLEVDIIGKYMEKRLLS